MTRRSLVQFESDYRMHLADSLRLQGIVQVYHPLKGSPLHYPLIMYSGVRHLACLPFSAVPVQGPVVDGVFEDSSKDPVQSI